MELNGSSYLKLRADKAKRDAEQKQQETIKSGKVVIGGIDIPFMDVVVSLVKISFAAIPAAIIVIMTWAVLLLFLGNLLR